MFSIRIVTTSHYQAEPLPGFDVTCSEFRGSTVKRVPVLRIFGSTPTGQKTCMHVHGVFPYLYVPFDGTQPADRYLKQFATSLDKAINIANRSVKSDVQHVFKISLVSGIPMYGYHEKEEPFLKIYLYNPSNVRKAADLLLGGAVMNKPFQPHESHLPYYLQLFMDYNLYGMNLISVGAMKFRNHKSEPTKLNIGSKTSQSSEDADPDVPSSTDSFSAPTPLSSYLPADMPSSSHVWNEENIPSELWHPDSVEKQSTCELEVDVVAADIINRHQVADNIGTNPGLAALWEDEKQRRRDAGVSSQLAAEDSQDRSGVEAADSEKELLARFYKMIQEQNALNDSQSVEDESFPTSQTSLRASQLERHTSREDSSESSPNTVILEPEEDLDKKERQIEENELAIVNMDSIHKVVASSQSFSAKSSQASESQDRTVAEILASLLEEDAPLPPSSQVAALEEKDSILSASVLLSEEDEDEEDRETLAMTQAVAGVTEGEDVGFDASGLEETWFVDHSDQDPSGDIVMETDDSDSDDDNDIDLLPQFDGASDKLNNSHVNQPPQAISENQSRLAGHGGTVGHGQTSPYHSSAAECSWMGRGNQLYSGNSSWAQQQHAWSQPQQQQQQQQQPHEVAWSSRSSSWGSQQQSSYSHWQTQSQQLPSSGSQYSPPQHPTRSPSAASSASSHSFHSPPHHPYTSPTHSIHVHQGYSSPGSSSSQHSFAHSPPHYQSPSQEMFPPSNYQRHGYHQYPSSHPYQASYSGQQFPQPMTGQSYKSPSVTQPYMSPPTTTNPSYQSPSGSISNQSPTVSQSYKSPSTIQPTSPSQPFASSNSGQAGKAVGSQNSPSSLYQAPCYQSPPYNHPYYSPSQVGRNSSVPASSGFAHFHKGSSQTKTSDLPTQILPKSQMVSALAKASGDELNMTTGTLEKTLSTARVKKSTCDMSSGKSHSKSNPSEYQLNLYASVVGSESTGLDHPPLRSPTSQIKLSPSKMNHSTQDMHFCSIAGPIKTHTSTMPDISMRSDKMSPQNIQAQKYKNFILQSGEENESGTGQSQPPKSISRLDFKPKDVAVESNMKDSCVKKGFSTLSEERSTNQDGKQLVTCNTPMIQQLLMEESPAKMKIKPEDREAVMKKPMLSPTRLQKKTKSSRGKAKCSSRPRSASLSVGLFPRSEGIGHQPPMLPSNTHTLQRAGRSQSISLPFGSQPGLMESVHEWQQQPLYRQTQQQNFSPVPQWQQQQHQWGGNQWQDSASVEGSIPGKGCAAKEDKNKGPHIGRTQQRSYSADCAPLLLTQSDDLPQGLQNQQEPLYSSSNNSDVIVSSEGGSQGDSVEENGNENDTSSLSNIYQLVSDVSFETEDNVWDNSPTTIMSGFLQEPTESQTTKSTSPSGVNQGSPDKKDFITLEPPNKTSSDKAGSDTTGMTSSEESDRMDFEIAADLIPTQFKSGDFATGWVHPRLGKQNRMKRMGMVTGKGNMAGISQCNPAYTYTFHVPTPVFKKLKFFRSAQARKQDLKIIRMHPMDARKYSLLKIGKELVEVKRLNESDLAKFNCLMPSPSEISQMTSDGSFNRVNLDIPAASSSQSSFNSFGEDGSSFPQYDTDFPPNKVAPPSSFSVTQVTASPSRSSHSFTPPVMSHSLSRTAPQFAAVASTSQYGIPGTSGQGNGSHFSDGAGHHHQGQQLVQQEGMFDNYRSGLTYPSRYNPMTGDQTGGNLSLPQINGQAGDQNFHHPSANPQTCNFSPGRQGVGHLPGPAVSSYARPMQYQQQSRRNDPESFWDPKNGLRSPGQHGPIGTIDTEICSGHSGEIEEDDTIQNTTGTFPINTRVNALKSNAHANFMATDFESDLFKVESSSRKSSLNKDYDGDDMFYEDNSNFLISKSFDMTGSQMCVKRKKTRRKRSKRRRHLKKSQIEANQTSFECDDEYDISCEKHMTGGEQMYSNSGPDRFTSDQLETRKSLSTNHNVKSLRQRQSRTSNGVSNKDVVNCRDKNWKSLKLQIPKRSYFYDAFPPTGSLSPAEKPSGKKVNSSDSSETSSKIRLAAVFYEDEKFLSPKEPLLGMRQSMRQAKLRSINVTSNSSPESPLKDVKKKKALKEGIHYIVVGKFKGHQSMLVKIPRLNITKNKTVSAAHYEMLASRDIVRTIKNPSMRNIDSLTTPSSAGVTDIESQKGRSVSTDCFLSENESDVKALDKNTMSLSDVTAIDSDFIFSGSPCTSPENHFFTELRKSLDKKCNRRKRTTVGKSDKNIFFPGIIKPTFLKFQTLFQRNISKLESSAYSSSSDEEDDHLDTIILKGKIKLATDRYLNQDTPEPAMQNRNTNDTKYTGVKTNPQRTILSSMENASKSLKDSPPAPQSFITQLSTTMEGKCLPQNEEQSDDEADGLGAEKISVSSKTGDHVSDIIPGSKTGVSCRLKLFFGKGAEREGKEVGMVNLKEFQADSDEREESASTRTPHRSKKHRRTFKKLSLSKGKQKVKTCSENDGQTCEAPTLKILINYKGVTDSLKGKSGFEERLDLQEQNNVTEIKECLETLQSPRIEPVSEEDIEHEVKEECDTKIRRPDRDASQNDVNKDEVQHIKDGKTISIDGMEFTSENNEIVQTVTQQDDKERKPARDQDIILRRRLSQQYNKEEKRASPHNSKEIEDERKEFIRRQMAFYEDISSDPDSDETILNESLPKRDVNLCPSLPCKKPDEATNLSSAESLHLSMNPSVNDKTCEEVASAGPNGPMIKEESEILQNSSKEAESPDSKTVHNSEKSDSVKIEVLKDIYASKQLEGEGIDHLPCTKEDNEIVNTGRPKSEHNCTNEMESMCNASGISKSNVKTQSKPKRKNNAKHHQEYNGSSSSDEKDKTEVSGKRLRQRKQTQYTYYLDGIDSSDYLQSSSENDLSDPSPAHVASRTSAGKSEKIQKKTPGKAIMSNRGRKITSFRGKKKKVKGGSKLLNSLSLLHMATLANLTESQDSPSSPHAGEVGVPYSDRAESDHATAYSPSLEVMSFTSPQNSEELDSSPLPFSPTDKKRNRPCEGRHTMSPSVRRKLLPLPYRHRSNIKPGCNGASNVGTRPFALNRLVNPVAVSSPVPSNLIFSNNPTESSDNVTETPQDDQMMQIDKMKTNPYSMKHILRLATTDDSMDSDSKDGLTLIKAPGSKRAQVKSTPLSMSDILKMTSINSADESENTEASNSLLSQIANFEDGNIVTAPTIASEKVLTGDQHTPEIEKDIIEISKLNSEEVTDDTVRTNSTMDSQNKNNDNHVKSSTKAVDQDDNTTISQPSDQSAEAGENSMSTELEADTESQQNTMHENKGQAALTPVTRIKPLIHPSYHETFEGEQEADQAQDKGLALTPGDTVKSPPVKCLSPLNCIIEETQLSRSSQDYVSSCEPDIHLGEDITVTSLGATPGTRDTTAKRPWSETADNSKDVPVPTTSHQKQEVNDQKKPELPVITETLVESDIRGFSPYSREVSTKDPSLLNPVTISSHFHQLLPSHRSPSQKKTSNSSSLHASYPWCWQWPASSLSEESISPLNLCTSSKAQNMYSPITPPSPMSPFVAQSVKSSHAPTSKLSPPVKKSKPLWYPWLSAEESLQKHSDLQKLSSPCQSERRKSKSTSDNDCAQPNDRREMSGVGSHSSMTSMIGPSTSPAYSSQCNKHSTLSAKSFSENSKEGDTSPQQVQSRGERPSFSQLKVEKEALSQCKTVSQFLGTVIDTAYEQASSLKKQTKSEVDRRPEMDRSSKKEEWETNVVNKHQSELPDKKHKPKLYSDKDLDYTLPSASNRIHSSYSSQEWDSPRQFGGQKVWKDHDSFIKAGPDNNSSLSTMPTRKSESERVQVMLENERILRGKFALSSSSLPCPSTALPGKESMSRTDRLVTRLIKGDEPGSPVNEPFDATKRRRKGEKSGPGKGCQATPQESTSLVKAGSLKLNSSDELMGKVKQDSHLMPGLRRDKEIVIQPVKSAPSRMRVEGSLSELGLNAVQVPVAFCSSLEDLPDKPMEQGGRVLKVASRRVCELKPFTSSHFIDGIKDLRCRSLASSRLFSSQAQTKPLLEQLQDEPQIRFLLTPDRPVVIAPCRMPVRRDAVAKWLQPRMKEIVEMKENIQVPLQMELLDESQSKRRNSILQFSPYLDSSPEGVEDSTLIDTDLDFSFSPSKASVPSKRPRLDTTDIDSSSSLPIVASKNELHGSCDQENVAKSGSSVTNCSATPRNQSLRKKSARSDHSCQSDKSILHGKTKCGSSHKSPLGDSPSPLLKHISSGTENALRRNILMSQTQRQFSELGYTAAEVSQIEGPTPQNTHNFKVPQNNKQDAKAIHKYQYVTTLSLELQIETRGDKRPDPEFDVIQAVFYSVFDDIPSDKGPRNITGMIVVDKESWEVVTDRQACQSQATPGKCRRQEKQSGLTQAAFCPQPSTSTAASSRSSPYKGKGRGKGKGKSSPAPSPSGKNKNTKTLLEKCGVEDVEVTYVQDEMDLLLMFVETISRFDPDILVGFEIQMLSWGYLLHRAAQLGIELCSKISRVPDAKRENRFLDKDDEWGADHMSEIHVGGRVVLNLWRILRHEVSLNSYTYENAAYHILHERVPLFCFRTLTKWFSSEDYLQRWRLVEHYVRRVQGQLKIIDQLNLIGKTSEFARVFGIEFFDVLSRGSQLRVESMMLRLAKPMNYVAVSPSVNQRARQKTAECTPLNLEPESKYYTSPVVVLDFQSLYPSIMIAYNYCFSTCLGRLSFLEKAQEHPFEFGCTSLSVNPSLLKKLKDKVTVSPNGVVFLKESVRKGIISAMVEEILNTRLMVKKSMKNCKDDKTLTRMLDARQLGLKLIANVTYGYTGASFSGRMPCIEVGDSIVRKARESLERAIKLVEDTPRWGAHVIYGDTDSMFIHFPGRTKDEAFVLGQEIADAVTAMYPKPMKLKFENVYLPCVLQTKKRYVGFKYETPDQKDPVFQAKGIETVRRDSCSAVSKILERSIKVLFSSHDVSRVRAYVTRQLHKLLEGKVSILDLIFAKEFRGMAGYKPGACVPALEIARKRAHVDRRAEPRAGERVPYVIVHGSPGLPLIQLVREPQELVKDTTLRLNAVYYITKQILPTLDRLLSLVGVNVFKWYQDMPKVVRLGPMMSNVPSVKQGTISQFFASSNCVVCDAQCKNQICNECRKDPQLVILTINDQMRDWERTYNRLSQVCNTCQGVQDVSQPCVSMDCPIIFRRHIAKMDLLRADTLKSTLEKFLQF